MNPIPETLPWSWINSNTSIGRLGRLFGEELILDADPGIFGTIEDGLYIIRACNNYPKITEQNKLLKAKYDELIMAVANKYPGESRHETALKYILRAEEAEPSQISSGKDRALLRQLED